MRPLSAFNAPPMALLASLGFACGEAGGPIQGDPSPQRVERRVAVMGTLLAMEIDAPTRSQGLAASEACLRALEGAEARLSTWRTETELARVNASPVDEPVKLGSELARELAAAELWWSATDGAFDPGLGALVEAWGLRSGGRLPSAEELERLAGEAGWRWIELDGDSLVRRRPGARIEEGGFGKGVGLDLAVAALAQAGATRAVLDLGGQVAVLGGGEPHTIPVAAPDDRNRPVLELTIDGGSVATTGNSERGIEVDGERRAHVLDPRTARPCRDFGSLTVWAEDATTADCLSTGLYVLGPVGGPAWALGRPGVEVVALERTGDGLRAIATPGLRDRLRSLRPDVRIEFVEPRVPDDDSPVRSLSPPSASDSSR